MANQPTKPELSEDVRSLLAALRLRVKLYVWFEGLAVAVLWLLLSFWFTYVIDYWLLVRGLAVELAWQMRALLLLGTASVLGFILYRWILRRAFARLADHSMAVVLERRFGEFRDSLVTSVEMSERPDHAEDFNPDMLSRTGDEARAHTGNVRLRDVFNFVPLFLSGTTAVVLIGTVTLFAVFGTDTFLQAASRIYLLDDEPWDRVAEIELVGVHVEVPEALIERTDAVDELEFDGGTIRVARGSNLTLRVRADADKVIPHKCVVKYWLDDGESGKIEMEKVGKPKHGYQEYQLDRQPFKGVATGFRFEVIGKRYGTLSAADNEDGEDETPEFSLGLWPVSNRLEGYVEVVESPIVAETTIQYVRPKYIDASQTPRTVEYRSGAKVEVGSRVTIQCRANKQLKYAYVYDPQTDITTTISVPDEAFEVSIDQLNEDYTAEITLHDVDDIVSETPYRLHLAASPDEPPKVDTFLSGIGSAVTPDVIIPFQGKVTDDHALAKTWIEAHAPEMDSFDETVQVARDGKVATAIDFQKRRNEAEDKEANTLKTEDGYRLTIVVKSEDHRDLGEGPNVGFGLQHELEIVTPDRLMVILEQLEAGQRERMEQIYREMNEAHSFLLKVRASGLGKSLLEDVAEPDSGREPGDAKDEAKDEHEIRLIFAQRALLQTRKSAHEINGVITTIRDIREQMINNRVDADAHKERLKEQIADPLQSIAEDAFPELERRLVELEKKLKALGANLESAKVKQDASGATDDAIQQASALLLELDEVLKMLRKLEDYNQLLSIIRELIKDEEELMKKTKEKYDADALGDLLD